MFQKAFKMVAQTILDNFMDSYRLVDVSNP